MNSLTESRPARWLLAWSGFAGAALVALSAWRAHGLAARLSEADLARIDSALTLLGWHVPAWLALSLLLLHNAARLLRAACVLNVLGVALFCGALLWVALADFEPARGVAPWGGSLCILSWLLISMSALRPRKVSR